MKQIVVASKNPVKIEATKTGFEKMFSNEKFEIRGVSVPSGVKDQPMSNKETLTGAINRATNALEQFPDANYCIGIEGGLEIDEDGDMEAFAWIAVKSKGGKIGKSRTSTFFLPKEVAKLIKQGMELGDADDIVFKRDNSKQQNGAVGILTGDATNRAKYYSEAILLALIPFNHPELY